MVRRASGCRAIWRPDVEGCCEIRGGCESVMAMVLVVIGM